MAVLKLKFEGREARNVVSEEQTACMIVLGCLGCFT